ncbi:MAG: tyrosine-type recombinase/integrase [Oscillospiraceae bacterium]
MYTSQVERPVRQRGDTFIMYREAAQRRFGKRQSDESRLSFDDLADNWLKSAKQRLKKTTFSTYSGIVDSHLRPEFAGVFAEEIGDGSIHAFLTNKCSESSQLSASTLRGIANVLKQIVTFGHDYGVPAHSEACKCSPKSTKGGIEVLTEDEERRILARLGDHPRGADLGILISLKTGLRIGEVCALKWGDISLDLGTLSVNRTVQRIKSFEEGAKTTIYFGEPKSADSRRKIPLSPALTEVLENSRGGENEFVTSCRADKTVEPRTMQRHFKTVLRKAGVRELNFHVLRHSFATKCVERGFDIKSLSMILGHSDVSITLNTYVHPSNERLRNMMALLDD